MTAPLCAHPGCTRAAMRERDGQWWCIWHPDSTPPQVDAKGRLIPRQQPAAPKTRPSPAYRDPGRVVVQERPARAKPAPAPADGLCTREGCDRAWRHTGRHRTPKPERAPRPPRPAKPRPERPADGLCITEGCERTFGHRGRHTPPLDHADVARRYQAGTGLFDLAEELHVGARRIRTILEQQGVPLRTRGQVIGQRGRPARDYDHDEARRLYQAGASTVDVARALGVKSSRIAEQLRAEGLLRAPGGGTRVLGGSGDQITLKVSAELGAELRDLAAAAGQPIAAYLRAALLVHVAHARTADRAARRDDVA